MQIRAFSIEQWAGTLDSRAMMPAILRRLINATIRSASRIDFPAWEGTQRPGWDGVVVTPEGNAFVPVGTSVWEIGTNADVKDKANEDFDKRTADPCGVVPHESTYICVTPRKWTGKAAWCAEKQALHHWKDVRAYDSDDLEQWMETAPAAAIWFGRTLGLRPPGVEDVERRWDAISGLTEPTLRPEVFVASRYDQEKKVIEWLDGPPSVLAIECRAPTEVIDFVTATLMRIVPESREKYLSRSVIVESRDAFDVLRDSKSQLAILIAPRLAPELELISSATQKGHHVLMAVIHDMIDECLNRENVPLEDIHVTLVTFTFEFLPLEGRKPGTLTFDVAWPSSCGLRNQRPERIEVALKYLKRWSIDGGRALKFDFESIGEQSAEDYEG